MVEENTLKGIVRLLGYLNSRTVALENRIVQIKDYATSGNDGNNNGGDNNGGDNNGDNNGVDNGTKTIKITVEKNKDNNKNIWYFDGIPITSIYTLTGGTYRFTGVPTDHPLSLESLDESSVIEKKEDGLIYNGGKNYYYGDITVKLVPGDIVKFVCLYHGYMGSDLGVNIV